jgi:hypothetical protein
MEEEEKVEEEEEFTVGNDEAHWRLRVGSDRATF